MSEASHDPTSVFRSLAPFLLATEVDSETFPGEVEVTFYLAPSKLRTMIALSASSSAKELQEQMFEIARSVAEYTCPRSYASSLGNLGETLFIWHSTLTHPESQESFSLRTEYTTLEDIGRFTLPDVQRYPFVFPSAIEGPALSNGIEPAIGRFRDMLSKSPELPGFGVIILPNLPNDMEIMRASKMLNALDTLIGNHIGARLALIILAPTPPEAMHQLEDRLNSRDNQYQLLQVLQADELVYILDAAEELSSLGEIPTNLILSVDGNSVETESINAHEGYINFSVDEKVKNIKLTFLYHEKTREIVYTMEELLEWEKIQQPYMKNNTPPPVNQPSSKDDSSSVVERQKPRQKRSFWSLPFWPWNWFK